MPPFMGGGEMIEVVGLQESTYAPPPNRFEPGTPAIAEAIAFGEALDYLSEIGMDNIYRFEKELGGLLHQEVSQILIFQLKELHFAVSAEQSKESLVCCSWKRLMV